MKQLLFLILALVLILVSCGKSESTGNVTVEAPKVAEEVTDQPLPETTPVVEDQPKDTEKVGLEEAGLFKAKYCNYKYGALYLQLQSKKDSVNRLEGDGKKVEDSMKQELSTLKSEVQALDKEVNALQSACKESKLGDQCKVFEKDIQGRLTELQGELKDDQESLQKWQEKLAQAKEAGQFTDLTIAQAKVDKITPRVSGAENQIMAFTQMSEDLKGFC